MLFYSSPISETPFQKVPINPIRIARLRKSRIISLGNVHMELFSNITANITIAISRSIKSMDLVFMLSICSVIIYPENINNSMENRLILMIFIIFFIYEKILYSSNEYEENLNLKRNFTYNIKVIFCI